MNEDARRLYLLDVLRGLASLTVVVWHYQHFFFAGDRLPADFSAAEMPFFAVLFPLYEAGWRAVQLFFVLSGFVFFHRYDVGVSAREFFLARFARLYPLHFATLAIVATEQAVAAAAMGQFVVYQCNDLKNFFLNLTLIAYWRPRSDVCYSFNAPIWSVSVEILLYLVFFGVAATFKQWGAKTAVTLCLIVIGVAVFQVSPSSPLGYPLFSFFGGGLVYQLWKRWGRKPAGALAAIGMIALSGPLTLFAPIDFALGILMFPGLIFLLAIIQDKSAALGRRFCVVGDITYSTYLLHFPIQIFLILCTKVGVISIDFYQPAAWVLFMGLVIAASVPTYYLFERPIQRRIRVALG
jgi:peptidoglycan/LPS O-acetylase OafA/YrhL